MKKFRTAVSATVMVFAAIIGFFAGAQFGDAFGGAILLSLIAGISCIIYVTDNKEK